MAEEESTDAAGVEANTESDTGPSRNPWPEIERDTERTTTDDEPPATDQTSDDSDAGMDRYSDESTGGDDESHGCDPDSPVPCRFQ